MQKAQKGVRKRQSMFDVEVKPSVVAVPPGSKVNGVSGSRLAAGRGTRQTAGVRQGWQHERRRRAIRKGIAFEVLIATIVGGNRLAILVTLAHGPQCVGSIQRLLGAPSPSHVSEELQRLHEIGLVTWELDGTKHIYRLTHRLRVFEEDGAVQLVVISEAGHWALLHVDEGSGSGRIVEPPSCFLDASRFEAALRRDLRGVTPGRRESTDPEQRRLKHVDPRAPSREKRGGRGCTQ